MRGAAAAYLGTGIRAVHDGVAAVERERVLQLGQALLCEVVSGVDHPAIGLGEPGTGGLSCHLNWPEQPSGSTQSSRRAEEQEFSAWKPSPHFTCCHLSRKASQPFVTSLDHLD